MTSEIGREKSPEFSAPGLSGTFNIEWVKRFVVLEFIVLCWRDFSKYLCLLQLILICTFNAY